MPADPSFRDARAALPARLEGVEGWFHEDEALELFDAVVARGGTPRIVEIGSWKGRSTITLATAVEALGGGEVIAIDPHTGSVEHREMYGEVDTFGEFLANLERAGLSSHVRPVRAAAHDAAQQVKGAIDVLFIDGSHEYDDVVVDLDDWLPRVSDGALVVVNDTSWPGVHRAVLERIATRRSAWREARLVRSTLFVRHRPHAPWKRADDARLGVLRIALAGRRHAGRAVTRLPRWVKRLGNAATSRLVRAGK